MSTNISRIAATLVAAATVTALTTAAAVPAPPPAPPRLVEAKVDLAASAGIYPIGPIPQAFRNLGMGTAQDFLNGLAGLAQVVPGQAGVDLKATVENLATLVAALQTGINLPLLGNLAIPEIAVPPMGPAGTVDQINTLQWSTVTQGTLSALKTALAAGDAAAVIIGLLGNLTGLDTEIIETLVADLPLNVPGTWDGPFFSSAGKLAIVPAIGLGGTNFALASPTLLNDPAFKNTAILAIALRNPSRTGGGILSLLNPLSSTVGLNLSNPDGTASHPSTNGFGVPVTVMDGNVTVWDFGAAYDIVSDAPSTVLNPIAWLNSGVGAVMPTYLLPPNVDAFFKVISDITGGTVSAGTINDLLGAVDVTKLLHLDVGADGNLYATYDSGRLPLLEPFQVIPRTLSYIPGFGFSTTFSDSFADVLTQLVAQGYQDVNMTVDADGVATFTRGWDAAGTQAKFWQNPITWEMGLETPQTIFNSVITGLQTNLLDPSKGEFEIFGNKEIGNLLYRNAISVAAARFLSQALEQVRDVLNPVMNGVQGALLPLAKALDDATVQVNRVIDDGLGAVTGLGVDLNAPMLDANRLANQIGDGANNALRGLLGLKPITSPPPLSSSAGSGDQQRSSLATTVAQTPAIAEIPVPEATMVDVDVVTEASESSTQELAAESSDTAGSSAAQLAAGHADDANPPATPSSSATEKPAEQETASRSERGISTDSESAGKARLDTDPSSVTTRRAPARESGTAAADTSETRAETSRGAAGRTPTRGGDDTDTPRGPKSEPTPGSGTRGTATADTRAGESARGQTGAPSPAAAAAGMSGQRGSSE